MCFIHAAKFRHTLKTDRAAFRGQPKTASWCFWDGLSSTLLGYPSVHGLTNNWWNGPTSLRQQTVESHARDLKYLSAAGLGMIWTRISAATVYYHALVACSEPVYRPRSNFSYLSSRGTWISTALSRRRHVVHWLCKTYRGRETCLRCVTEPTVRT